MRKRNVAIRDSKKGNKFVSTKKTDTSSSVGPTATTAPAVHHHPDHVYFAPDWKPPTNRPLSHQERQQVLLNMNRDQATYAKARIDKAKSVREDQGRVLPDMKVSTTVVSHRMLKLKAELMNIISLLDKRFLRWYKVKDLLFKDKLSQAPLKALQVHQDNIKYANKLKLKFQWSLQDYIDLGIVMSSDDTRPRVLWVDRYDQMVEERDALHGKYLAMLQACDHIYPPTTLKDEYHHLT
jgi:hypothetical protein